MAKGFSPGEANILEADLSGLKKLGKGIGRYFKDKAVDLADTLSIPGDIVRGEPFSDQELRSGATNLAALVTGGGLLTSGVKKGAGEALLGMNVRGKDIAPRKVFHASPNEIKGGMKFGDGVGIHFAENPELATNAAIKSKMDVSGSRSADMVPEEFNLNISEDQIVDIKGDGAFDFYEILEDLFSKRKIKGKTFNDAFDKLEKLEGKGDISEMYRKQNLVMKNALDKENIKVLRYFNKFDSGPNWRDIEKGDVSSKVKPDYSYMVFDNKIIGAKSNVKKGAGEALLGMNVRGKDINFNKLRKDATIRIDNPQGRHAITNETYVQQKIRQNNEYKIDNPDIAGPVGLYSGKTGTADNVKFHPSELINIKGMLGEEKFRMKGKPGYYNKLKGLQKSIKEKGYKPESPIVITVIEDGTPYINEGSHRIAEAFLSKRPFIEAEIHYLRGGESVKGPLNPQRIGIDPKNVSGNRGYEYLTNPGEALLGMNVRGKDINMRGQLGKFLRGEE